MPGVGLIGGGAILKHGLQSIGTATAASLWATGPVGAAVDYGLYDAAILSASIYVTFRYLATLKTAAGKDDQQISKTPNRSTARDA
jgi:putative Mg2+ transporter-C (MgtC) family protein